MQGGDDRPVGVLEHVGAGKRARLGGEGAGLIHRTKHRQAVCLAGVEVIDAVAGRGVDQARAGFGGDVVTAQHHRAAALEQGVLVGDAFQLAALEGQHRFEAQAQAGFEAGDQLASDQQVAGAGARGRLGSFAGWGCGRNADAADGVVEAAVHRHRQVGGQGPGGGGPDGHSQLVAGEPNGSELAGEGLGELVHRKGHIHAR